MNLTLNLNIEEVNLIIRALGRQPFEEVYELIGKINEQANIQLSDSKDFSNPNDRLNESLKDD